MRIAATQSRAIAAFELRARVRRRDRRRPPQGDQRASTRGLAQPRRDMTRIGLLVVASMLLGTATFAAQGVRYGVGAGLLLPLGDYHSLDKPGWIVGADVTYWFASASIAIRAEGSYSRTGQKQGACCLSDHAIAMAGGLVDIVYAFGTTADQIRPYLVAGVGLYNWRLSAPGLTTSSETKVG